MLDRNLTGSYRVRRVVLAAIAFAALAAASTVAAKPSFIENAGEPFQAKICYANAGIYSCGNIGSTYDVPEGYTAVVQFMTASCTMEDTDETLLSLTLTTIAGGADAIHYFPLQPVSPPVASDNRYAQAMATQIYADGNTALSISANAYGSSGRRCFGTISGRLIED